MIQITQRPIDFRIWCIPANAYCKNYKFNGKISKIAQNKDKLEIWEQYTGIKDKNKKKIFEGDFVEFDSRCGDYEFLNLNDTERKNFLKTNNKKLLGVVQWSKSNCGFDLVCGDPEHVNGKFTMEYATFGEVIGNILKTPKLVNISIEYFNTYMELLGDG